MADLMSDFIEVRECDFKGRHYSVRDNGAIFRHSVTGSKASRLDNVWTFGKKDQDTGYMFWGGVRVHQIVCTAFHGNPKRPNLVVDHIDTNRCNNRPENLRWVTRLENILENPLTRRKIEFRCGSIQAFLDNPSILKDDGSDPNFAWMRTVSREEAATCICNLQRWMDEDHHEKHEKSSKKPVSFSVHGNGYEDKDFGESWDKDWVHREYHSEYEKQITAIQEENVRVYEEQHCLKDSLTPGAKQLNWVIPSEFPLCPKEPSETPLLTYLTNLKSGLVFCRNSLYQTHVHIADISEDGSTLAVISTSENVFGACSYFLSSISFLDGCYVHKSLRSFHDEQGARKYFTIELGREWSGGDVFDDFC